MITAQDIGALAMIEKLTRIWLTPGTPRENISVGFDGDQHQRAIKKYLLETENQLLAISPHADWKLSSNPYRMKLKNDRSSYFRFCADRGDETYFCYFERGNCWDFYSTEPFPMDEEEPDHKYYGYMGHLRFNFDGENELYIATPHPNRENSYSNTRRTQFIDKWLPFFRRNCWLCGCNIECTQEERAEWIQGLTPEEIEDWQLKV